MSGFILKAACHGHRPTHLQSFRRYQRPGIVAQLLRNRSLARFIVAPSGYGKTSVALEYAETVFQFVHVFWINGRSPCFLRDLDAGCIASCCMQSDSEATLVVFDDVPPLDDARAELLWRELDGLLEWGCEVLVACEPSCDVFGNSSRERICVSAENLLLSDEELDIGKSSDEKMQHPSAASRAIERIPGIVWGSERNAQAKFVADLLKEESAPDFLLATASVLVLRTGQIDDLLEVGPIDLGRVKNAISGYPHLGFDFDAERFDAFPFLVEDLGEALRGKFDLLVPLSNCEGRDALVSLWANMLVERGLVDRACDVMRVLCARSMRGGWVLDHRANLIASGCFYASLKLMEKTRESKLAMKASLSSMEAVCRYMLGDTEGAIRCSKRYAFDSSAPYDARVCSLIVLTKCDGSTLSDRAREVLGMLEHAKGGKSDEKFVSWQSLADACLHPTGDVVGLYGLWKSRRDSGCDKRVLFVIASWLYRMYRKSASSEEEAHMWPLLPAQAKELESFVRSGMIRGEGEAVDFLAASAALSMERAHMNGLAYFGGPLETSVLIDLRRVELSVLAQRRLFERDVAAEKARRSEWASTHPDMMLASPELATAAPKLSVPTLSLKFFGKLSVEIGGQPVDQTILRRSKVRGLIVLLALNEGREVPRDVVCSSLWPYADADSARNSFYTHWSRLRRMLMLPDGTCPYLQRQQGSCSLEERYVESDLTRFNEICRELLFGQPDQRQWARYYSELDRDFSCDFLPAEQDSPIVARARREYRARLADALVAASSSLVEADNAQWGIWYARMALQRDETREDAYVALMRAQAAAGQRTAAITTYFDCRRALAEHLGVDPSPETEALYESLLGIDDD